jgi:N-acetylmuramoyl-L-alanine amidase
VLALVAWLGLGADWRTPPPGEGPETAPVRRVDGTPYLGVNDLARLMDATKFWRADVRKLVLRSGAHSIALTADNPFVIVDDLTVWLPAPVRSMGGELQVPVALVDTLPSDSALARLIFDPRRDEVIVLPASGGVGSPRLATTRERTRVSFPVDRPEEAVVVARSRAHFRLRFGGIFLGVLPDSLPAAALVRSIRPIAAAGGCAFECAIDPAAEGFRLIQDEANRRVVLELSRSPGEDLEVFAPEGPAGPRSIRVVVLDPGHGGSDAGVVVGGVAEKNLSLALAQRLRPELERRLAARVVLTRGDDREVSAEARAEVANRVHADLVLALHFDGFAESRARGATAYCPPATFAEAGSSDGSAFGGNRDRSTRDTRGDFVGPGRLAVLPWRDVASRYAVQSRALAEAVLSTLELRGQGPTRLRERLPYGLLGVNAPGILLECATLTSGEDRERVTQQEGLRQLAVAIADGVAAYRRNE